jgi:CHAD domain-containing protein
VKDLTYLVALLEPLWPPVLLGMHETLKRLGDRLGEDRDLALLRDALAKESFLLPDELALLQAAIAARRALLRTKALPLARRLFAERPRRFTARLGAYWKAWRAPDGA